MPQGGEYDSDELGDLGGMTTSIAADTLRPVDEEERVDRPGVLSCGSVRSTTSAVSCGRYSWGYGDSGVDWGELSQLDRIALLWGNVARQPLGLTTGVTFLGLIAIGAPDVAGLTRQGFFQALSAHTTTGWATIPSIELSTWGDLAFVGIAIAMALGGMAPRRQVKSRRRGSG